LFQECTAQEKDKANTTKNKITWLAMFKISYAAIDNVKGFTDTLKHFGIC
jgi:hypothetical protein